MTNIIPFASNAAVPAFLQSQTQADNDLTSHASQGFPSISIKGKVFTIVSGGERKVIPNAADPRSPATHIDVVIIKCSPDKAKTYYAGGYKDGATGEDAKPTCFSNDGKTPDVSVAAPQCKTCAACKWNVFGTNRGADGSAGRGKACADFVRIVVATPDDLETMYLLRVPPASIKALGELGKVLSARKVPYQGVITEIAFDIAEATPRLVFTPRGFVSDKSVFDRAIELSKSEDVHRMIYGRGEVTETAEAPVAAPKPAVKAVSKEAATEQIVQEFEQKATQPVRPDNVEDPADALISQVMGAPAQKPAAPKPAPVVVDDSSLAAAIDSIGFDD